MDVSNRPPAPVDVQTECVNNCGFFGNPKTAGMCSKCYADSNTKPSSQTIATPTTTNATPPSAITTLKAVKNAGTPLQHLSASSEELLELSRPHKMVRLSPPEPEVSAPKPMEVLPQVVEASPMKKTKPRCNECRAKLSLMSTECKCGFRFCSRHRYPESHKCSFDYKAHAQSKLAQELPKVAPKKILEI